MESKNLNPVIENKTFWEQHFEQFKLSNLSKAEYARRHQLVPHRFLYWAHKFETPVKAAQDSRADFIPITVGCLSSKSDKNLAVLGTLQLGNGKQLLVHSEAALRLCLEIWR